MTNEEAKTVFLNRGYVEVEGGTIYDADKWREACVVISEWLEQRPCEDTISRQAAIEAVKKNTFRLTFAEERDCKGHVAWSAEAVYSDVIEGSLLELPPVTSQPKTGYISINDVMSVFDDFMCGEVDEDGTDTFLEMLKDKAEGSK